jgi:hypothetical protein
MSLKNNITKNILENIELRKKHVQLTLTDICRTLNLSDVLGRTSAWAIVGGVVRDCLLSRDPYTRILFSSWPDVDVAVAVDDFDIKKRLSNVEDMEFSVKLNKFGGWKVKNERIGELDIWKIKLSREHRGSLDDWLRYLDNVDFAINAVAFTWPECQVVIHHRWCESLKKQKINILSPHSTKKHLQPIRGIALAVKLEEVTKLKFKLGREVVSDLVRVLTTEDENIIYESLNYIQNKISSGRWPFLVLQRFLLESANRNHNDTFYELTLSILGEDLKQYVTSRKKRRKPSLDFSLW